MIEVYLFLAMFPVQILILSILFPARLTRQLRAEVARYTADGLPQLHFIGGRLVFYRWLNTAIALLGLALLVGLFRYMQQPDWDDGPVETLTTVYAMVQFLPFCVAAWWARISTNRSGMRSRTRNGEPRCSVGDCLISCRPSSSFYGCSPIRCFWPWSSMLNSIRSLGSRALW